MASAAPSPTQQLNDQLWHELRNIATRDNRQHIGSFQRAQELIEQGADVNAANGSGQRPIIMAAHVATFSSDSSHRAESLAFMEWLIGRGADVNIRDNTGRTPIFGCGLQAHHAQLLLANGADPWARDNYGRTAAEHIEWASRPDEAPGLKSAKQAVVKILKDAEQRWLSDHPGADKQLPPARVAHKSTKQNIFQKLFAWIGKLFQPKPKADKPLSETGLTPK